MAEIEATIEAPQSAPAAAPAPEAPAAPAGPVTPNMFNREEGGFDGRQGKAPAPAPSQREAPEVPAQAAAPVDPPKAPEVPVKAEEKTEPTAPASAAPETPAEKPTESGEKSGFVIPESLSKLFSADEPEAPAAAAPETPAEKPTHKYANDTARAVGEYLAQGGTMEDVQVYQNQEQLKAQSDFDIVLSAYQKDNPTFSKEAISTYLESKFGGNLTEKSKTTEGGEKVTIPVDQAALFGLSQEAKKYRQEIDATVAKVAGVVDKAASPAAGGTEQPNNDPKEVQTRATQDGQLALRAARDVMDQNPELSIAASHDGVESTVKVKLSQELKQAIEGPLAATVAQIKNSPQFQKIDHTNATQFQEAVHDAYQRLTFAFTAQQTAADLFADGVSKGREMEVQRAAGLSGSNIYNKGGSAPSGGKRGTDSAFDAFRKADALS